MADINISGTDFLDEYFSKTSFGTVKLSELELLVFYALASRRGDLDKSVYELAQAYYITEQKAARFKTEIGKRFTDKNTTELMEQLAKAIFEDRAITLDWENTKIGIPVYNPMYLYALKKSLSDCNLPYETSSGGSLVRLSTWVFIAVFAKSGYSGIQKNIKGTIKKQLEEQNEYDNLFASGKPLSLTLKEFLKNNAQDILRAIPVVGNIISITYKAGEKFITK